MVVETIEYSRFGNEEVLDLLKIDSTALDVNQVSETPSISIFYNEIKETKSLV